MGNLFKYEFRKIYSSKLFYICLGICVAFIVLNLGLIKLMNLVEPALTEMSEGQEGAAEVELAFVSFNYSAIQSLLTGIGNASITLIGAVFITLYVSEDYRNGVIKNIYGKGYSRANVFIAKYVISLASLLVMSIVSMLLSYLLGFLFFGNEQAAPSNLIYNLLVQLLTVVTYHAVFFAVTMAISKIGIVMVINILGLSLITLVVSLASAGLDSVYDLGSFNINDYWFASFLTNLSNINVSTGDITIMLVANIIYTGASLAIGYVLTQRKDV
ncbi:MAG: ABC transporter permease subunit [Acholeplasmatales bacterium]|nr:ABC transporter permease subunit [Acholeplasmatales bacterium]